MLCLLRQTTKTITLNNFAPAVISDWMYVDNGKLVGGYTLRVLRDTLPAAERAEFDKSLPFTID